MSSGLGAGTYETTGGADVQVKPRTSPGDESGCCIPSPPPFNAAFAGTRFLRTRQVGQTRTAPEDLRGITAFLGIDRDRGESAGSGDLPLPAVERPARSAEALNDALTGGISAILPAPSSPAKVRVCRADRSTPRVGGESYRDAHDSPLAASRDRLRRVLPPVGRYCCRYDNLRAWDSQRHRCTAKPGEQLAL